MRKHSGASRVRIDFGMDDGHARVTVHDDWRGFRPDAAPEAGDHAGLQVMGERAADVGGSLTVDSTRCLGTSIVVRTPMRGGNHD